MFSSLREALEHNRQTQNPRLDLGKLGLKIGSNRLKALEQLKDFEWVETLIFSDKWYEFDVEKDIHVEHRSLNNSWENYINTAQISLPKSVEKIVLSGQGITDISFLLNLTKLEHFDL